MRWENLRDSIRFPERKKNVLAKAKRVYDFVMSKTFLLFDFLSFVLPSPSSGICLKIFSFFTLIKK